MGPGIELAGKRVLVVGLARTGLATALFCAARGARVTATEARPEAGVAEAAAKLRAAGCTLELGTHCEETFLTQDLIIPSPGVAPEMVYLAAARAKGIPVWSEVELASRFLKGQLIGVTGSNGKTTTASLIAHILKTAHFPALLAGNIGTPLVARVEDTSDRSVSIVELSSFQLETIAAFRPHVAVLLNVTPDHLDRHPSLQAYGRAKARIFENQMEEDAAVVNADDALAAGYAPSRPQVFWFSRAKRPAQGAFLRGQAVAFRREGEEIVLLQREAIGLRGEHNVENVLAAAAASFLAGVRPGDIAEGVRTFAGVEHRLEFVAEVRGVSYYNDSKATNVDAALKALDAFPGRVLVILGGKDKGSDYSLLQEPLREKALAAFLIGEAAQKIEKQVAGSVPAVWAATLERALELAAERARPGDTVLLAPACASFDQFESYEHRGRVFKLLVRQLEEKAACAAGHGSNDPAGEE